MSTHLEFRQDLPRIQIPSIKIQHPPPPAHDESCSGTDETHHPQLVIPPADVECRTPTSKEHKIPPVLSCPPAPRKPKRIASCKRKLSELNFFEIVNRDEVESFFRSSFQANSKKRCPCT